MKIGRLVSNGSACFCISLCCVECSTTALVREDGREREGEGGMPERQDTRSVIEGTKMIEGGRL